MAKKIWEPINIKGMRLKNRLAFAPFLNMPAGEEGYVSDLTIRWFEQRAKGGLGFILTGTIGVAAPSARLRAAFGRTAEGVTLRDDKYIPGWAKLVSVIHSHGTKIGAQFTHGGPMVGQGPSPSPFPDETHAQFSQFDLAAGRIMPVEEVSVEQIEQFEREDAAACGRAKAAGFDCVELHCAHGGANIQCSFISPFYNRRTDKYGGSWENRLRFSVETIQRIRETVGPDFPILVRIDADELLGPRGITVKDACQYIVPALEKAGVDGFDVSQGSIMHSPQGITIPMYYPRGYFIHHAEAVKKVTRKPVIGVGRIVDLDMAEKFLQEGKADIIYMGSQVTADPETPNKYFQGKTEDIRKCIGCKGGCGRPCVINYDIQDAPIPMTPAQKAKKVLVIGGGVGGMEAARIATLRGHKVTLIEKESELGGMVATLALNPLTAEFKNIVEYLSTQMRKLAVDVRICREATMTDIEELKPDVVILAAGSSPTIPEVARGKLGVMTHDKALKEQAGIGQRVVVWGFFGAELAISLAEQGKDVVLIGRGAESAIGSDVSGARRFWLLRKLTDINFVRESPEAMRVSNPKVLYNTEVEDIVTEGVKVVDKEGVKQVLPCDTLILSRRFGERKANDSLFDNLKDKVAEVYKIGDCLQVRGILEAIWSANEVARKI
jgi:2,4-dienoyl-CoA reductase-like NADH-dependent reductase (Old Yellow Enzyme family)/thioredoxin reductase